MKDVNSTTLFATFIALVIATILCGMTMGKNKEEKIIRYNYINILELEEKIKLEYFTKITGKKEIAEYSIKYTRMYDVDLALFVALMKAESRFNPRAVNLNIDPETKEVWSIDRGLCQLNSATFPYLTNREFFNPEANIMHAVNYLRNCLDSADNNKVKALAFYNAGIGSVKNKRIGEKTLNYINYILNEKERYDDDLARMLSEVVSNAVKK
jgi:hypothetical protein